MAKGCSPALRTAPAIDIGIADRTRKQVSDALAAQVHENTAWMLRSLLQ